jgi:hypothetical protein
MPQVPSPSSEFGRLQALFYKPAKQACKTKKGRKFDLATALQPKGDTRATNAKTEYHETGTSASSFVSCCLTARFQGPGT